MPPGEDGTKAGVKNCKRGKGKGTAQEEGGLSSRGNGQKWGRGNCGGGPKKTHDIGKGGGWSLE